MPDEPNPDEKPKPDPDAKPDAKPEPPAAADKGYPDHTPVVEMTDGQQAAYWRAQSRKHEGRAKAREDYDDVKAKAARLDAIEAANATEQEKAAKAAREEGKAEGYREATPRIVRAEFRAAAAGRIESDRLAAILEPLDLGKFLDDSGDVDTDKVSSFVDGIAPDRGNGFPDLGQGRRDRQPDKGVSTGRDMYASRRPSSTGK